MLIASITGFFASEDQILVAHSSISENLLSLLLTKTLTVMILLRLVVAAKISTMFLWFHDLEKTGPATTFHKKYIRFIHLKSLKIQIDKFCTAKGCIFSGGFTVLVLLKFFVRKDLLLKINS